MGGLFLIGSLLVSASALAALRRRQSILAARHRAVVGGFAAVGFWDDWIKLRVEGREEGCISKREKQGALTILGCSSACGLRSRRLQLARSTGGPHLHVPFVKDFGLDLGRLGGACRSWCCSPCSC